MEKKNSLLPITLTYFCLEFFFSSWSILFDFVDFRLELYLKVMKLSHSEEFSKGYLSGMGHMFHSSNYVSNQLENINIIGPTVYLTKFI